MTGGGASQQMRDVVCVVEHKEIMVSEPQLQASTPQNIECITLSGKVKSRKTIPCVKVTQLCLTPCDPMDCTVCGILQAGILEWVAVPFSRGSSQPRDRTQVSCLAGGFFTS